MTSFGPMAQKSVLLPLSLRTKEEAPRLEREKLKIKSEINQKAQTHLLDRRKPKVYQNKSGGKRVSNKSKSGHATTKKTA